MIPPFNTNNLKWILFLIEKQIKHPAHIGIAMKLTNLLLSRNEIKVKLQYIEEEDESKKEELENLVKTLSLEVFNLTDHDDEFEPYKSDYDYITSNKVHFLEYRNYQQDVDLINMEEVESVDLDEIAEECEQFHAVFVSDFLFRRPASF